MTSSRTPRLRLFRVNSPAKRVKYIGLQVKRALRDPNDLPLLRRLVINDMIRGCGDRDDRCHMTAVFDWWKKNLPYIPDPVGLDLYQTPLEALRAGGGDCDCHVIATCSSLALIGVPVGARVIRTLPAEGSEWHVYGLCGLPRGNPAAMIPIDTTWPQAAGPGAEFDPSRCAYRKDWMFDLR